MRGVHFQDINHHLVDAILMSRYNQPYSEIDDIPTETVIFLMRLIEAENDYEESEIKKIKNKNKR